jgi:hypothetical protein
VTLKNHESKILLRLKSNQILPIGENYGRGVKCDNYKTTNQKYSSDQNQFEDEI